MGPSNVYIAYIELILEEGSGGDPEFLINIVYNVKEDGSWGEPQTVATTSFDLEMFDGPFIFMMMPVFLNYGSLHLGYIGYDPETGDFNIYYTSAQTFDQEDPGEGPGSGPGDQGRKQPTDQQKTEKEIAERKLTQLPETGGNPNLVLLLLSFSTITPHLIERVKIKRKKIK